MKSITMSLTALAVMAAAMSPAAAQNRFMDRAKEDAARRAENVAIREAEHPDAAPTKTANAAKPATAEVAAAPAAPAPVAPAPAPAAPATPAPAQ